MHTLIAAAIILADVLGCAFFVGACWRAAAMREAARNAFYGDSDEERDTARADTLRLAA